VSAAVRLVSRWVATLQVIGGRIDVTRVTGKLAMTGKLATAYLVLEAP
jgi:hypothetical protein